MEESTQEKIQSGLPLPKKYLYQALVNGGNNINLNLLDLQKTDHNELLEYYLTRYKFMEDIGLVDTQEETVATSYRIDKKNKTETDPYDSHSTAVLLKKNGSLEGICRVVRGQSNNPHDSFPVQHYAHEFKQDISKIPLENIAEASRFYVYPNQRGTGAQLLVIKGIIKACHDNDISHLFVFMEKRFHEYCKSIGLNFDAISEPFHAHNKERVVTFTDINKIMNECYETNYPLWRLLTEDGKLYSKASNTVSEEKLTERLNIPESNLFTRLVPRPVIIKMLEAPLQSQASQQPQKEKTTLANDTNSSSNTPTVTDFIRATRWQQPDPRPAPAMTASPANGSELSNNFAPLSKL